MTFTSTAFSGDIFGNIAKRISGPANLRLIIQPVVALEFGIRDGIMDAKAGEPPYFFRLFFDREDRWKALKGGIKAVSKPFVVTTLIDAIVQFYVLERISLIGALLIGGILAGLPYAAARGLTNRVARRWYETQQTDRKNQPT